MLLAVDIGNSNIVFSLHDGKVWLMEYRVPTHTKNGFDRIMHWNMLIEEVGEERRNAIEGVILSSVVPNLTQPIAGLVQSFLKIKPIIVGRLLYGKLPISITNEEEIGTDLVANAVAAHHRYEGYKIVVDFGTALTFTTINDEGKLLGVAIAPGLKTALNALFQNAAQLPEVPIKVPDSVIGLDTFHALQSGVLLGYVGLVTYIIECTLKEVGKPCKVIATGGLSFVLGEKIGLFDVIDRYLTLDGLRLIYEAVQEG